MSVLFFLIDETDVYVCAFLQKKKTKYYYWIFIFERSIPFNRDGRKHIQHNFGFTSANDTKNGFFSN